MNIGELLAEYEHSHFESRDFVPTERIATPAEQDRARREYEADPVKCLLENVEQSRSDVRETAGRMRLATQDGLLDRDMYRSATPDEKKRWRAAVGIVRGDFQRATSEFKHWREFVEWEMERQRAKAADIRLPPEGASNGEVRHEVQAGERADHSDQQPGESSLRDGAGEDRPIP